MRRVVAGPDGVTVVSVPVPVPAPAEVLIRPLFVGICGSDTHAVNGRHPHVALPYHPGHEVVGVVAGLGADVRGVAEGQRVVVEPDLPCWACKQCRAGRENLCENLQFLGCGHEQGAMAEFFVVDHRRLHVVPDELDDRTAALIEPLATPVHAARLAGGVAGRAVAVLGAGTIGLLAVRVAQAQGATRVVVTARSERSRERARAFGADATVDATAPDAVAQVRAALGESADVVFDCVGEQSTVIQAFGMADKGGTVVVVGVPPGDVTVPLALIQDSQLRLQGSATYLPEDWADAMRLLAGGVVRADELIGAVHPLGEAAAAFADAGSGAHIKVLVRVPR
jgi:2-desacetyl-2-hydroxyethyl bacteriochlorophyllide A dehydrogenase